MKTPSFSYMGGKARLRKRLIEVFPKNGKRYIEPFTGAGNVFFLAKQALKYQTWLLNDKYSLLLLSLRLVDLAKFPEHITKPMFDSYKTAAKTNDPLALVLEPRISFGGKGYKAGFAGNRKTRQLDKTATGYNDKTDSDYRKDLYLPHVGMAKELLDNSVCLYSLEWIEFLRSFYSTPLTPLGSGDFIYLDPPYYGTKASYPNIDHYKLCEVLNIITDISDAQWALSGYDNEIYRDKLNFKNKHEFVRMSEMKMSNTKQSEPVVECLWTNY